jgi:hypothetical protein
MALGAAPTLCSIESGPFYNRGMARVGGDLGVIPELPLDAFHFDYLDALQLDCEGHEDRVIAGAEKTIRKHRPVISLENPSITLVSNLETLGYQKVGECGYLADVRDWVFAAS